MDWPMIRRILLKALLLFLVLNVIPAVVDGTALAARFSLYNSVFPGRQRLPYGDDPRVSFNVTLTELDAMFAATKSRLLRRMNSGSSSSVIHPSGVFSSRSMGPSRKRSTDSDCRQVMEDWSVRTISATRPCHG